MAFRHVLILSSALLIPTPYAFSAAEAEGQLAEPVENGKQPLECKINADAVYMHSGAGTNYYPTGKLSKGDKVIVVGAKFDWLKIIPPEGSFSYVSQAFVERVGNGSKGRVTRPDLNVRCGSTLTDVKAIIQTKLDQGAEVEIIGEQDEYFKIKPPTGAYLFVNKQYVDPVKPVQLAEAAQPEAAAKPAAPKPTEPAGTPAPVPMPQETAQGPGGLQTETPGINGESPTTKPAEGVAVAEGAPSTQPSPGAEFDRLEAAFAEASDKPIADQPIAEIQNGYAELVKSPALPETLRRTAEYRIKSLQVRADAKAEMEALKKSQEASAQRRMALKAEQDELSEQIKTNQVKSYTAVGTLNTSSLQQSKGTLFRLCDPATGRTLVYLRVDDSSKYTPMLGQFIGVKGDLSTDPTLSMKVITPNDIQSVDQTALYKSVAAEMIPPSMLPKDIASTNLEQQQQ